MIHILKHMAVRIWTTAFLGGLSGLWILMALQFAGEEESILLPVLLIMVLVFISTGWLFNRIGLRIVKSFIHQAGVWERGGMLRKAEQSFLKALAVFDSFLISPIARKKNFHNLFSRMAGFYLARPEQNKYSQAFIVSYIYYYPADRAVAESWLQQVEGHAWRKDYQELALRIGNAHQENMEIQKLLLKFYLAADRTDFPALRTYRRVLRHDDDATIEFAGRLASLFLKQGRADEWALWIYLQALEQQNDRSEIIKGLAACFRFLPKTEQTAPLLKKAAAYLTGLDEALLERLSTGFKPPLQEAHEIRQSRAKNFMKALANRVVNKGLALPVVTRSLFQHITTRGINLLRIIKKSGKGLKIVKWTVLSGLAVGVIILLVNTVNYLVLSRIDTYEDQVRPEVAVTRKFTIQVAAYLKPEHAERYIEALRKKGLDAYYTSAAGTKKKWYQVRVSHFADKASARVYGESLKAKGIIKDFYVANYNRQNN